MPEASGLYAQLGRLDELLAAERRIRAGKHPIQRQREFVAERRKAGMEVGGAVRLLVEMRRNHAEILKAAGKLIRIIESLAINVRLVSESEVRLFGSRKAIEIVPTNVPVTIRALSARADHASGSFFVPQQAAVEKAD